MRLSGTKTGAINQYRGLGNQLWDLAGNRPSLDLPFSETKSLIDTTTGTNLIDFTRASSGTYVGSDGLIKTATTNLLTYSQEFDNVAWSTSSLTITPDNAIAPDGTQTADLWFNTSTTGIISNSISKAASAITYTASLWVKSSDAISFSLTIDNGGTVDRGRCVFNLTTGELLSTIDDGAFTGTSGTITTYPDSWYRLTVTTTTDTGTTARWRAFSSGSGDIVYIWGAQLEQSSTVGEYIKTTSTINSAPRFDHDPTTGESLGLLVEESRENIITLSIPDNGTVWNIGANIATTLNNAQSPDGTTTATKYEITGGPSGQFVSYDVSVSASTDYTFSFYVKNIDASDLEYSVLDLDGLADIISATSYSSSVSTDSWTRITVTFTTPVGCTSVRVFIARPFGETGSFYAWGAQLEEGSFSTSYIPTEGTTVTRAADVASIGGSNFSSWYRQDEGTLFLDAASAQSVAAANVGAIINDGTLTNTIELNVRAGSLGGAGRVTVRSGGTITFDTGNSSSPAFAVNTFYRQSASYKLDSFAYSLDGGVAQTDISGGVPTAPDRMEIGARLSTALPLNGTIRRLCYWNQRLPNETLQGITQ